MHVSRQPNSGYKALTFFFTFERLGDCCGLIKAFGEGWLRQRMGLNERTIRWRRSRQRAWARDRPWLCVRWERECESVRGCARERVRGCARDGCARERVRVRQYRVICEALKFEFSLLKLEFLRLGFTLVNRVSDTRDLRVQIHVDTPRGLCPHQERKPSLRGSILGLEIEPLRLELLIIYIVSNPSLLTK